MDCIPRTFEEIKEMLRRIGKDALSELFKPIPQSIRLGGFLRLHRLYLRRVLSRRIGALAKRNEPLEGVVDFLGAEGYDHAIHTLIWHTLERPEFYTAYTQYQPGPYRHSLSF